MAGVFRANIFEREQFGADGTIAPLDLARAPGGVMGAYLPNGSGTLAR